MSDKLRVGSLFSGIGGFDLGFERAGFEIAWQCEIDPHARAVLAKHWPATPCYMDVREVGAHSLAKVDVLCGGFPCQDISYANGTLESPKGLEGTRSGLWREFARIIAELRPGWVAIENVGALRTRGLEEVILDLSRMGYDAEWRPVYAYEFGLPHARERLFIVAWSALRDRDDIEPCPDCEEPWCDIHTDHFADCPCRGIRGETLCGGCGEWWNLLDSPECDRCGWLAPDTSRERAQVPSPGSHPAISLLGRDSTPEGIVRGVRDWTIESPVYRVDDGVPGGMGRWDQLKALGNAIAAPAAEFVAGRILEAARP